MEAPMLTVPARLRLAGGIDHGRLLGAEELGVAGDPKPEAMRGALHGVVQARGSMDLAEASPKGHAATCPPGSSATCVAP